MGEAVEVLQVHVDNGDMYAATLLAELLTKHGREEEALELWQILADDDETGAYAATQLAQLLARQGKRKALQVRVDAGDHGAAEQFINLVAEEGLSEEAERLRRYGLLPDR